MKYVTPELLRIQDSDDSEEAKKAGAVIEKNVLEYEEYFNKNKNRFSKEFLNIYENNYRFHDWNIEEISYRTSKNRKSDEVELKLSHVGTLCVLRFKEVSLFRMDTCVEKCDSYDIWDKDIYYVDEWEFLQNGRIKYEMLSLLFSQIEILCKKVTVQCLEIKS